jgi:Uma2 family endonuclease
MTALAAPPAASVRKQRAAESADPEDLVKLADNGLFELVNGKLVEKGMSFLSGDVATEIVIGLGGFVKAHQLGKLVIEVSFQCFPEKPSQTRRPDLAFISAARLGNIPLEGHVPIRPDLAIEVMSPNDNAVELDGKLIDYQSAGIPLVWVVNPTARSARVYRPDGSSQHLLESDTLDGQEIVPGFRVTVADLIPLPAAVTG